MSLYKNEDIKSIEYQRDLFRIKWRLTGWCNYKCPYCIDRYNKEENGKWNKIDLLINRAKAINNFLKSNNVKKKIHLSLLGGEVTYLDLKSILAQIDNISHVHIDTNLSRKLEYFYDLFNWAKENNIRLFINCSYHEQNLDFESKFITLTNWCKQNKHLLPRMSRVIVDNLDLNEWLKPYKEAGITRIMLTRNKEASNDEFNSLQKEQIIPSENLAKEYESARDNKPKDYKVTFKDGTNLYFTSISHFLNSLDNNGFIPNGFNCNAGCNGVLINWDGSVYGSHCFELADKPLGNIDTDKILLNTDLYYCNNPLIRCCVRNGTSVWRKEE